MSRDITFYAEKNRNQETRIELYWTGADSAQLLFEALKDLSYENSEGYIEIGKAAREIQTGVDEKIAKLVKSNRENQSLVEGYHNAITKTVSIDIFHEIMEIINYYNSRITENQEEIEFYKSLRQTVITICNLDFLQTKYDGTPSEWELYVLYSY